MDLDRSTRRGIAFDDKVLCENAAPGVCDGWVRSTVEVAIWGLHPGAASAQPRAARLDQKRNERATLGAVIGEEVHWPSARHNSSGQGCHLPSLMSYRLCVYRSSKASRPLPACDR